MQADCLELAVNIALIATPIIIAFGFIFAYRQLKAARADRIAQIILSLASEWDSDKLKRCRAKVKTNSKQLQDAVMSAEKEDNPDLFDLVHVGNFFDTLGMLVAEGFLTRRIAYDLFGHPEGSYFQFFELLMKDRPEAYKYWVALHRSFEDEKAERSKIPRTPSKPV